MVRQAFRLFLRIPILGSLSMTTLSDYREAARELLVSLLISMSPVYIGAFSLYIVQPSPNSASYLQCIKIIIQNGELFIYAAAVLAPVMYIVTRDRYNVRTFPSKFTFISAVILVALLSTCIFTIERIKSQVLPANILNLSVVVFFLAISVFYFALVYNNTLLPNPADLMRDNEQEFSTRLRKHRNQV